MKITIDLPENIAYLLKIYALILEYSLEGMIEQELENVVDHLSDGQILGEEIQANYKKQFESRSTVSS